MRGLGTRSRRLVAAAVAAIIGTAFLTASITVLASAKAGLEDAVAAGIRDVDLVVHPGEGGILASNLDAVAALPIVDSVVASTMTGVDWRGDFMTVASLPPGGLTVTDGVLPTEAGQVAITTTTAEKSVSVGDTMTLTTMHGASTDQRSLDVHVVGIVDPGPMNALGYGSAVLATTATIRQLEPELSYDSLLVQLIPGTDVASAGTALVDAVPGAFLQTGAEAAAARVDALTGETTVMSAILLGFSGIALLTAAIVIANTFTITLAQRAGELALLRCVGATKRQVRRMVLLEAVVLGLVASALGVLTGLGVAAVLLEIGRRSRLDVPLAPGITLTIWSIAAPVVVGVLVTVLAALLPAAQATRVSPLAALRPAGAMPDRARFPWVRLVLGVALFGAGVALMALAVVSREVFTGLLGGVVSFAGVLLAIIAIIPVAVRGLGLLIRPLGVPGGLAVDNAVRNPGRAAATSAALLVGVTLITMTLIGAASGERTALGEIDEAYAVDFVVTAPDAPAAAPAGDAAGEPAESRSGTISATAAAQMATLDGVSATAPVRTAYLRMGRQEYGQLALGLDSSAGEVIRSVSQLESLVPGTLGLSGRMQAIHGLEPGETVRVSGPGGARELRVVALGLGEMVAVNTADLEALGGAAVSDGAVLVRTTDRAKLSAVLDGLTEAGGADVTVQGQAVDRAMITRVLDVLVAIATALLGVGVLIALVGIANTLTLSVIERHREHALLRGLGLTRLQLRLTLLIEALLLAAVSAGLGLALGLLYAWLGVQTILPADTPARIALPGERLALVLVVALVAGMLASVLPARRATRVTPVDGLAAA